MLDIAYIRENQAKVADAIKNKGADVDLKKLLSVDEERRALIVERDDLRAKRNDISDQMKSGKPDRTKIAEVKEIKVRLGEIDQQLEPLEEAFTNMLAGVPNVPSDDTPIGNSEDQNVVVRTVGEKPSFDFEPNAHWDMPAYVEQERAAKISGARFAFVQAGMAQLQMALMNWAMLQLTDQTVIQKIIADAKLNVADTPFMAVLPPVMMRTDAYQATSRLKPDDITFRLANDDLWLIGSAEHSMCAYYKDDVIDRDLPVRFAGYSPSFRREVGSAGQDTRGILRVHQFNKLEMECFTDQASSYHEHLFLIAVQEYLTQQLELPYQVVLKCTADMGGPNIRGVDIETWMPGQGKYRETHSADYIGDYQTRGLNTKYVNAEGKKVLAHTNDATAVADRTLIAIMENYQQADGSIVVPKVLRPYMNGRETV